MSPVTRRPLIGASPVLAVAFVVAAFTLCHIEPIDCNYLRMFPLYSEVYVREHDTGVLRYLDRADWWDYPTLAAPRKRIEAYVAAHPMLSAQDAMELRR
jgi:hypothetical protein